MISANISISTIQARLSTPLEFKSVSDTVTTNDFERYPFQGHEKLCNIILIKSFKTEMIKRHSELKCFLGTVSSVSLKHFLCFT